MFKFAWLYKHVKKFTQKKRKLPHRFIDGENHILWGQPHVLTIKHEEKKPFVALDYNRITLTIRADSKTEKCAEIIHAWHKSLLHEAIPPLIEKWERILKVKVSRYFLQRMKTRWGSCNYREGHIRLNTELIKKPKNLLEYVIVHELAHLIEPSHNHRFKAILDTHYPLWRETHNELNALPQKKNIYKNNLLGNNIENPLKTGIKPHHSHLIS